MTNDRPKVPREVVADVVSAVRRRCCVCYSLAGDSSEKRGQIAHLDHNAGNNALDNLAFLCLDHHDEYDSRTSQSKGLTLEEVKRYRSELFAFFALPSEVRNVREQIMSSTGGMPHTGENLFGRAEEMAILDRAWNNARTRVVAIVAWGGVGKSTLVNHWRASWLNRSGGPQRVFARSFYKQGTSIQATASAEFVIDEALEFFGDPNPREGSAVARAERLAHRLRDSRTLLILDGVEPLQDHDGLIRDDALSTLLRAAAETMNGLCVLTTRPPFRELAEYYGTSVEYLDLGPLSPRAGAELLRKCGVSQGQQDELEGAAIDYQGHALALRLLGRYLAIRYHGDIRCRWEVTLSDAEIREGKHAWGVMRSYDLWFGNRPERAILRLLGLFDRPANLDCVEALREPPAIRGLTEPVVGLTGADWNEALSGLREAGLLDEIDMTGALDVHPLVREYFGNLLSQENPQAYREAHSRIFARLNATTQRPPETFRDLQPLYQAVHHGCRAGLHQAALDDIFKAKIRRGDQNFSTMRLGAMTADLAALAAFFDEPWSRPCDQLSASTRAWLLSEAGYTLRAAGRLRAALDPTRAALTLYLSLEDWRNAIRVSATLATLLAHSGDLGPALVRAEENVVLATRWGTPVQRAQRLAHVGFVLHWSGRLAEAHATFSKAASIDCEYVDDAPASLRNPSRFGFHAGNFCALLIDLGDREGALIHARQALGESARRGNLRDDGLEHLALGRALAAIGDIDGGLSYVDSGLDRLRKADEQDFLALGLIAKGTFLRLIDKNAARNALQAALRIAERCGVRVAECDGYLLEFSLQLDAGHLTEARGTLERATSLAHTMGYHLREPDLLFNRARLASMADEPDRARSFLDQAQKTVDAMGYRSCDHQIRELRSIL